MTDQKNTEKVPEKVKDPKDFVSKYQDLCEEYQMQIVVVPQYKSRDDGTFSTILATSVGRLPQKEANQDNI